MEFGITDFLPTKNLLNTSVAHNHFTLVLAGVRNTNLGLPRKLIDEARLLFLSLSLTWLCNIKISNQSPYDMHTYLFHI